MSDFFLMLENTQFSTWLRESNSIWAYPTVLTLHTVGLGILVGANAALDLRVLGWGQGIALADMRPLFRWMWIGFWINALSGVVLLAADASTKAAAPMFLIKLGLVGVGVVLMSMQRREVFAPSAAITPAARALAASSLTVWLVAIGAGRLMAYPGLFFGL